MRRSSNGSVQGKELKLGGVSDFRVLDPSCKCGQVEKLPNQALLEARSNLYQTFRKLKNRRQ